VIDPRTFLASSGAALLAAPLAAEAMPLDFGPKIALIRFQGDRAPDVDEPLHALFVAAGGFHYAVAARDSWVGSFPLQRTGPPVWPMGASVAAFKQGPDQLTVLYVEPESGQLNAQWRFRGHAEWNGPAPILPSHPPAPSGGSLAVAAQGSNRWFVVFADKTGNLFSSGVDGGAAWTKAQRLTPSLDAFAEQGSNVVAIEQAPGLVSALFVAKSSRRVHVCWRETGDLAWNGPAPIHSLLKPAPPGAGIAAASLPGDRWWVFYVDDSGTLTANRVTGRDPWQAPEAISVSNTAPPGALVAAANQTDWLINVFVVDRDGVLRLYWRAQDATQWSGPLKMTPPGFTTPGAAVTAAKQSDDITVVVVVAGDGRPYICWVVGTGQWQGPARISWSRLMRADVSDAAAGEKTQDIYGPFPQSVTGSHVPKSTARIAQLTGPGTLNPLDPWGGYGVDLGASTDHKTNPSDPGRLYIFSGDVTLCDLLEPDAVRDGFVDPDRYPPWDADLVAYTDEGVLRKGGFAFRVVSDLVRAQPPAQGFKSIYHPFTVERLGLLGTDEGPTGAFSYDGRVYVFVVAAGPVSYLATSDQPDQPHTFALRFKFSSDKFWQVAPVVVRNADHPELPAQTGDGLVMIGQGGYPEGVHLAWMPLAEGRLPERAEMLFYAGATTTDRGTRYRWSPREEEARNLFAMVPGYTAVSLAWLPAPARWIVVYSRAKAPWDSNGDRSPRGPIVARVAANLTSWSDEIVIYDPARDRLNGVFWDGKRSWAYGAFIIHRFTSWSPGSSEIHLRFLLSLFEPYQLQLVESRIHLPDVPFWRRVVQVFIQFLTRETFKVDRG